MNDENDQVIETYSKWNKISDSYYIWLKSWNCKKIPSSDGLMRDLCQTANMLWLFCLDKTKWMNLRHAKWKKSNIKRYLSHDSTYVNATVKECNSDREQVSHFLGLDSEDDDCLWRNTEEWAQRAESGQYLGEKV